MTVPFGALNPLDGIGIRCRAQFAAGDAAEVVGDDVVVANAAGFAPSFAPRFKMDAIDQFDQLQRLDEEAGFLAHLADDAIDDGFTQLEHAAGQRPMAFEGFAPAAHEQYALARLEYALHHPAKPAPPPVTCFADPGEGALRADWPRIEAQLETALAFTDRLERSRRRRRVADRAFRSFARSLRESDRSARAVRWVLTITESNYDL